MFRKILFGTVALTGILMTGSEPADASWRRGYRNRQLGNVYNGHRVPRRAFRPRDYQNQYYLTPGYYYNSPPGYYHNSSPGYYYGPGVGVQTPGFGFYVR